MPQKSHVRLQYFKNYDHLNQHMYEYLRFFRLYRNQPISAFAEAVMELSYLEDWKMAKCVITPIYEEAVFMTKSSQIK